MSPITQLLSGIHAGDEGARNALFAAAYQDLRRLAHARLRDGGRDAALDTTTLVNESYLRFVQTGELRAEDRRAFFAYASKVMRSVILDTVRARQAERRGGDVAHVTLCTELMATLASEAHIAQKVHEALDALEQVDTRLALVVRLRFFAGYTMKEIARALKVTERTAQRLWEKARLLLAAALGQ